MNAPAEIANTLPSDPITLEGMHFHGFACEKCGVENRFWTLPPDGIFKCFLCAEKSEMKENASAIKRSSPFDFLFSSSGERATRPVPAWAMILACVIAGMMILFLINRFARRR